MLVVHLHVHSIDSLLYSLWTGFVWGGEMIELFAFIIGGICGLVIGWVWGFTIDIGKYPRS